jgi:hypothetical protein
MTDAIDRLSRAVAHRIATARDGDELYCEVSTGPETEDTVVWQRTANGVEVWLDVVYPAMARLPAQRLRTLNGEEAHAEIVASIRKRDTDGTLLPYFEKRWAVPT